MWSSGQRARLMLQRVRIPLKPTVFSVKFVFGKKKLKRGQGWPIFEKSFIALIPCERLEFSFPEFLVKIRAQVDLLGQEDESVDLADGGAVKEVVDTSGHT